MSVSPDETYANLYRYQKNSTPIVVSNLRRKGALVTVKLDSQRLGLVGEIVAFDALTK